MQICSIEQALKVFFLSLLLALFSPLASAVHDDGAFELDGNPAAEEEVEGDDWDQLSNAVEFTGIIADPSPVSIFTGGRKDIQDIPQWSHKHGSVPDKDDLTNAYAAAYAVPSDADPEVNDLVIYFGADRFANTGDAFMGFWFFQSQVVAMEDGSFSGQHVKDDTLVLVDYPQGANEDPYIAVIVWDTTCSKAASNDPSPGDCAAKNLRMKAESDDGSDAANCAFAADDDHVCAITNADEEPAPWIYTPKAGVSGTFPIESFYEGGINLTQLVGNACFSSFMAETRSSSSFTASLKDFVLKDFELCDLEIVKTCPTGTLTPDGDMIIYDYSITVTNTGFGALHDIEVIDVTAGEQTPVGNYIFDVGTLNAGESEVVSGSFKTLTSSILNKATVTAALVPGGETKVSKESTATCPGFSVPGKLNVTKECDVVVADVGGAYGLKVNYNGMVCNDSAVKILDVTLFEEHDGIVVPLGNIGDLAPGSCKNYADSYVPAPMGAEVDGEVSSANLRTFSDTIQAFGTTAIFNDDVESMVVEASCDLCPAPEL
ncbi:hypothetical protein [Vibrio sp. SCSIO 43137]|uniref:hypothetical protein n=1 Tax=Vibrio sp. SCSIO 43137 TaxID=3021011 RepID=UPI002307DF49|nr:hypothetical protein [Vibrio sp. SCSIO 43137]WCE30787.1 hypothetical protein PK654_05805 [Vibrio sp. SCSIO 43137]